MIFSQAVKIKLLASLANYLQLQSRVDEAH